jgi:hypothetical protein
MPARSPPPSRVEPVEDAARVVEELPLAGRLDTHVALDEAFLPALVVVAFDLEDRVARLVTVDVDLFLLARVCARGRPVGVRLEEIAHLEAELVRDRLRLASRVAVEEGVAVVADTDSQARDAVGVHRAVRLPVLAGALHRASSTQAVEDEFDGRAHGAAPLCDDGEGSCDPGDRAEARERRLVTRDREPRARVGLGAGGAAVSVCQGPNWPARGGSRRRSCFQRYAARMSSRRRLSGVSS